MLECEEAGEKLPYILLQDTFEYYTQDNVSCIAGQETGNVLRRSVMCSFFLSVSKYNWISSHCLLSIH